MPAATDTVTYEALKAVLPAQPLYEVNNEDGIGWELSPEPYALSKNQYEMILRLGPVLWRFVQATQQLYRLGQQEAEFAWLRDIFNRGKPESLVKFAEMNRVKNHYQLLIRPDLLVTPEGPGSLGFSSDSEKSIGFSSDGSPSVGFSMVEMESLPAGVGFTLALQNAYDALGFNTVKEISLSQGFLDSMLEAYRGVFKGEEATPTIAIVISKECATFKMEWEWFIAQCQQLYPNIVAIEPQQLSLRDKTLGYLDANEVFHPIHIVYRRIELFNLPNVPQIELLQYAAKKGMVFLTPPLKHYLEEKLTLALVHAPVLSSFWQKQLGDEDFALLKALIPKSWLIDSTPLPYQAYIEPALMFNGKRYKDFAALGQLTQKERQLVLKPSGFSDLARRSHGVVIGHDVSQADWQAALASATAPDNELVYLMQEYHNTLVQPYRQFDSATGEIRNKEGRTRLCPYYSVIGDTVKLAGVLVTTCPKDKKVIHGMKDGVMRPAYYPDASLSV